MVVDPLTQPSDPLYQQDSTLTTHTSTLTSLVPLSTLPEDAQSLFKPPPEDPSASEPHILTAASTIFHAQGGGQPSDTGTISFATDMSKETVFTVHQVRSLPPSILHLGTFLSSSPALSPSLPQPPAQISQSIDAQKRTLHSRLHTAGHALALAINALSTTSSSGIPPSLIDSKASHYPGAAYVEFLGLIPGTAKAAIQAKVDELVAQNLAVEVHFWDEERARKECTGGGEALKGGADGRVRVVMFGGAGSYPCGGTHVRTLGDVGRVVVRNIKRQKGVSKVSYEVADA
ncbi:ThrRS/AlaRS common domain-containing protein [Corynespora cassiicola Philippines]|uniref:ThrRS/AlaRS common domain-containing protein n=1 Tax=Corynespora cassiicola Philippines TaxID=1448308 RepID=A0A2T2NZ04_CORCC|nr:ThrRS/AlaRS common domain-containing protein [Corynespora cassiicola Philippines]